MPSAEPFPSHSLRADAVDSIAVAAALPAGAGREWARGGSTGKGARVCVLDSGIEAGHPMVGTVERAVRVVAEEDGARVVEDEEGDVFGHGTACAGIIRDLAPDCELASVRVLGRSNRGSGVLMLAGLRWAIEEGYDVVNMSLSSTKRELAVLLHEVADDAYFQSRAVVASAHNLGVDSYPWRFSSVISVGSHELADPQVHFYNPAPPVEFYGRGVDIEVAWLDGGTVRSSGNSYATAHVTGICALILAKHPELTPFELKNALYLTAANVSVADG